MDAPAALKRLAEELAANNGKVPEHIVRALEEKIPNPMHTKNTDILREVAKDITQKIMYGN